MLSKLSTILKRRLSWKTVQIYNLGSEPASEWEVVLEFAQKPTKVPNFSFKPHIGPMLTANLRLWWHHYSRHYWDFCGLLGPHLKNLIQYYRKSRTHLIFLPNNGAPHELLPEFESAWKACRCVFTKWECVVRCELFARGQTGCRFSCPRQRDSVQRCAWLVARQYGRFQQVLFLLLKHRHTVFGLPEVHLIRRNKRTLLKKKK